MKFRLSHLDDGIREYVLGLSKPLFSKNKKHALFKFSFTELIMGGSSLPNLGTVVMKKENDKWVVLYSIREAVYH